MGSGTPSGWSPLPSARLVTPFSLMLKEAHFDGRFLPSLQVPCFLTCRLWIDGLDLGHKGLGMASTPVTPSTELVIAPEPQLGILAFPEA